MGNDIYYLNLLKGSGHTIIASEAHRSVQDGYLSEQKQEEFIQITLAILRANLRKSLFDGNTSFEDYVRKITRNVILYFPSIKNVLENRISADIMEYIEVAVKKLIGKGYILNRDKEDVKQESISRISESLNKGNYDYGVELKYYVGGIVVNVCYDYYNKSRKGLVPLEGYRAGMWFCPDIKDEKCENQFDYIFKLEKKEIIDRAIQHTPKWCQRYLKMRLIGIPPRSIAETLGLSVGAVRTHGTRCKGCLILELKKITGSNSMEELANKLK